MNKVALYVRVSTADQSVDSQLRDLREFYAARGLKDGNRSRVKVAKLAGKRYFSPFGSCFSRFLHLLNSSYHIISLIFRNL